MAPNPKSFDILLLGNDPGQQQWSILDYGEQLRRHLTLLVGRQDSVTLLAPNTQRKGLWLQRWRIGRAITTYGSRYILYPRLIRGRSADIFHILDHANSWLIRYLDPTRTVIFCHDLIPLILLDKRNSLFPRFSDATFRHAISGLHCAAAILANSTCTRQDLMTRLGIPESRIHVIPLGIEPDLRPACSTEEVEEARAAFTLPEGSHVLHVGHPAFYKNIEGILYSLEILSHRGKTVWLVRAGPPLYRNQRGLARRLGISHQIVELGPLSRKKLRQLYWAVDLLVHPSWYEGMGLPPLEAMACGLPVVVSNRGALPETVGEAGLYVDPASPQEIADAMERGLRDSSLRAGLKKRGLKRASQFRWETTAQQTLEVYRRVLDFGID